MSKQIQLIPEKMPKGRVKSLAVADLPDGLPGPKPTKEFLDSIEQFGIVLPIVVIDHGKKIQVVDGRRRLAAARLLEIKKIPARVYEDDGLLSADAVLSISLNRLRSSNPVAELEAIEALIKAGAGMREIRAATGLPQPTIGKRLKLQKLNKRLRSGLSEGQIAVTVADAAAKLPVQEQVNLARIFRKEGKLTAKDVREEKSARAVNELEQIPASVFVPTGRSWEREVMERLSETYKLVPEGNRDLLEQFSNLILAVGKLEEGSEGEAG